MHRGHVKLYRNLLDSKIMKNENYLKVYIYILLKVTDKVIVESGITLNPGQMFTSKNRIVQDTEISRTSVDRALKCLKADQVVDQQVIQQGTVITLINWVSCESEKIEGGPLSGPLSGPAQEKIIPYSNIADQQVDQQEKLQVADKQDTYSAVGKYSGPASGPPLTISSPAISISINNNTSIKDNVLIKNNSLETVVDNTSRPLTVKVTVKRTAPAKEQSWRTNFNLYEELVRAAYEQIINDPAEMAKQQEFHPDVNIDLTLQKALHNFWAKPAGWDWKKTKRSVSIDMTTTLINAISKPANKVYNKTKAINNGRYSRDSRSDDRTNEYANVR